MTVFRGGLSDVAQVTGGNVVHLALRRDGAVWRWSDGEPTQAPMPGVGLEPRRRNGCRLRRGVHRQAHAGRRARLGDQGGRDAQAQRALTAVDGHIDVDMAREIWKTALDARWDGVDIWFHGDTAPGNLLLDGGELAAVIDFGTCGVGDPSCDMAIAWTLLTADGRQAFRERLSVDEATWARGRGWALWKTLVACAHTKTLVACAHTVGRADEEAANARRVLVEISSEYSTGSHYRS